jgi:flagellar biosynthesis chaperone FliJ
MKNKIIWIIGGIALILIIAGAYYLIDRKNKEIEKAKLENGQLTQTFEQDKHDLEGEYTGFAKQYDELRVVVKNDKMSAKLQEQQSKIQGLLKKLHTVKATNATEILKLKRELDTMRKVLVSYVHQIDSLNRENKDLRAQTAAITSKYNNATLQINSLAEEKQHLNSKVKLAAQLDVTGISLMAKNKKGKVARKIGDVKKFQVNFTIVKNITAETGEKTIYVRISKPDNGVLGGSGTFKYENRSITYSMKRTIEYTGQEQSVTLYWDVDEYLYAGSYRVDIFADGNLVGSRSFGFEK